MHNRILNNPHYKPTKEQLAEIIPEYGVIPKHDVTFEKHPTGEKRKKRTTKKSAK